MSKPNRNYNSGMFTHLFGEPDKEFELYNAVAPGRFPPDTPVKDMTLKDALYMDRVNDLSFLVGDVLIVLFEHQGSINENMPLRDLIYCGRVYEMLVSNASMYSENRVTVPTPEFYVLYNGKKEFPEKAVYRLSDSFAVATEGEPALELVVNVFNVNEGFNKDIISRSETLSGYVTFVSKVREYEKSGMTRGDAVGNAVKDCISLGILAEYLEKYASEVLNMLFQEWNWDDAKDVWQREAEERERDKWQSVLADKDAKLADNEAKLADKDALIAKLRAQLNIT